MNKKLFQIKGDKSLIFIVALLILFQITQANNREKKITSITGNNNTATTYSFIDPKNQVSDYSDTLIPLPNGKNKLNISLKRPKTKNPKGVIVLLPGWNLSAQDWCTKTTLCEKALQQGYILLIPEMEKSIYAQTRFPETRKDWLRYATREWFKDTLIPYFQKKYKILLPHKNNYILGLSTGARGVALLCIDCPDIFKKGAGLSGDYDQTLMPKDALITGYYGSIDKFPHRWTGFDNPVYQYKKLKIPIYLGHGRADKVVPVEQTIQFADSLKKYKPNLVLCHIDGNAGHNYEYWNSEVEYVLRFFEN